MRQQNRLYIESKKGRKYAAHSMCSEKTLKCQSKYTTLFIYPAVKFNKNVEYIILHIRSIWLS